MRLQKLETRFRRRRIQIQKLKKGLLTDLEVVLFEKAISCGSFKFEGSREADMKKITRFALFSCCVWLFFFLFASAQEKTFTANLRGKDEVPPVDSSATGQATFQLSGDGKSLMYTLSVSNIGDVTMAHIHIGSRAEAGKPVAPLYPTEMAAFTGEKKAKVDGEQEQKMNGVIAKGTVRASSLTGPFKGRTIADLVAEIQAGKAYVNVHTKEHPDGEIRGTIQ